MNAKKYFNKYSILLILIIYLLTGCGKENQEGKMPPKKILGVSMASMKEDVFTIMKKTMYNLRKQENVKIIWRNAGNKIEKQKKDIEYLLEQNVDIFIINPVDSDISTKLVKKILDKKIPVIAIDRLIENVNLSAYITTNSFKVGIEQAKYLSEQIDHKGKILILKGDKENNVAYEITAGNKEILKDNLKINIVAEEWHKAWSPKLAEKTVREVLSKHPDIKGILANNSNMAMSAVKVLKEKNMVDKVVTVGADASKEACIAIAKGEHNADIDKMPYILALTSFKAAIMIVHGKTWYYNQRIKNGEFSIPVKQTPIMLIDKYNLVAMKNRWDELDKYIKKKK